MFLRKSYFIIFFITLFVSGCQNSEEPFKEKLKTTTWSSYLGGPDRNHFSTLSQITKENVSRLKIAWQYEAPDYGQMQMNPIVVDTILYGVTAALRVVALQAETGKEIWRYGDSLQVWHSTSRGVSYWEEGEDKRILFTKGHELFALNAITGKPITEFGVNGKVDMHIGMPETAKDKFVISNTPGTIFEDLIIMPLRVSEDAGAAPGNIMAFNIKTGKLEWVFHTIPLSGEAGNETWEDKNPLVGAANNWAGMAVDEARGVLYVPTGSAAPDFYGGIRKGSNLFANCLLALDAKTGNRLWHFQFTHHDIWDRDPPAPPNLITITRNGKKIPAVAQVTKQGYVYVFHRETGDPLFDINEVPVPSSSLKGEKAWETQPFPVSPKPFARQSSELTKNDVNPYAKNQEELKAILNTADKRIYALPGIKPVLLFPGYDGAAEWGGASADPEDGILYVNSNEMAWILEMEENKPDLEGLSYGESVYQKYCAVCHQKDRSGMAASGFPSLINISDKLSKEELLKQIKLGKGMMIGFPQLTSIEKEGLISFLMDENDKREVVSRLSESEEIPYKHKGYNKFLTSDGLPAISPPWGTLHAIDLNSGEFIWSVPFGETPELKEQGYPTTGTENYGGAVMDTSGYSTNIAERFFGSLNYLLQPLQHRQCMRLMGNSILLLPVEEKNWAQKKEIR